MDLDTMTTTAGTKESAAGPILPETAAPAVEEAGKVNKNGSPADSTDRLTKEKDSDLPAKGSDAAAAVVVKNPPENSATQPSAAAPAGSVQPKKQEEQKSPAKESPSGTAEHGANKPEPAAAGLASGGSSVQELQDDDMENDELSKRLEAMEKGEDLVLEKADQTTEKAAGNHQNGLNEREADKPATAKETDTKSNESVTSATSAATAEAKSANTMLIDDNGANTATATDAVTSNAKRKLLGDALGGANEPETKKVHIADVTDSSASPVPTNKSTESPQPLPIEKIQSKDLAASTSTAVPPQTEKPSSVEEMEVDGSPEPETSSSNNVETLPDTEPNTEPESEDKGEEISSSVADQPMKQEEDESTNSNVSSSDDKREGGREGKPKLAESEVSASALTGPSEDEAMDVDEDEGDMAAESSTSAGTTVKPVPIVEPPCIKKSAYLCYDKDQEVPQPQQQQQTVSEKTAEVKPETASPTSASVPGGGSSAAGSSGGTLVASTSQKSEETMEVDSASKAASSAKTDPAGSAKDEADSSLADDSKKHSATPDVLSTVKRVDESVVESSQPSSSSDTKKQSSDSKRADDQLRAAVHRSALLAKASSTPTNSGSASAPTSSNPSTPNPPVVASAVSSSNVFSSTPIHANFECKPVTSGNVSKITNPPSSVETSRIEPDDSTELLHSSIVVAASKGEEKESSKANTSPAASTTSSGKVSDTTPTKTESASSTAATTASTSASPSVRQTPPKKDPALKQEPQSPSGSSSRSSSKTIDSSEVDSCTVVSAMNTTEEINLYKNNAKKFNGISSTSSDVSDLDGPKPTILITSIEKSSHAPVTPTTSKQLNLSEAIEVTTSSEQQYEVSVWYEGQDLQFLSIEKLHCMIKGGHTSSALEGSTSAPAGSAAVKPHDDVSCTDSSAAKQSSTATTSTSNGSVTSLGPFPLPDSKLQASNASSDSSSTSLATLNSQHGSSAKLSQCGLPKVKQTVTGSIELCDLIINEFRKLKRKLQPEHTDNEDDSRIDDSAQQQLSKTPKTPATGRGQSRKESSVAKKSASRGQKRTKLMQDSEDEDEHEYGDDGAGDARTPKTGTSSSTSKQAAKRSKQAIESPSGSSASTTKAAAATVLKSPEPKQFDICCLARWTDRKYYAGRVTNQRGDKFVVIFEDGCSKTLSRDIIVFGEDGVLPILNHSIHALTGGDTYEPAIVEEIKRNETSNDVVYCVRTASSTLEIAATDIYLTDEQAKWIHNACKDKPDPIKKLLSGTSAVAESGEVNSTGSTATGGGGGTVHVTKTDAAAATAAIDAETAGADGEKGSRSTRSKRTTNDKPMTPGTPEAGYSGGVGKKGRRGRRKIAPPLDLIVSECSDGGSDGYDDEQPAVPSPEAGLEAVDGVQPELQRTEQESELAMMKVFGEYFGEHCKDAEEVLHEILGPIPSKAKTLFRNKHFLLSCTIPPKSTSICNGTNGELSKNSFSTVPFLKQHLRRQIEAGGGKVYQFFEDVPKSKYKLCKLIAPRPATTAKYVQCLASGIMAVSHEWIIACCQSLVLVDPKPYTLPSGWSFLEQRYMDWGCVSTAKNKRSTVSPFASVAINLASLSKDFNDFWSRVCKLAGATVRLIKTEADITENLTGYLLTDQEFPEEIKIKASRNGLLVVSTVWVVQCLINGAVCHPHSHEKLTQIYQEDDY